jgi:hypothetical protein
MLFGNGGVWLIHCPKPDEIWLGGWYEAASLAFFVIYLLNLAVFIMIRFTKPHVSVGIRQHLIVIEDWTRRMVPIGGALTCGLLLLARSIENRRCEDEDHLFLNTYRCNPLADTSTFPADTALVAVIVPPFMQIVLKLDRVTTFFTWLICWCSLVSSACVLHSYNVNFWFTLCGSSIPIILYEIERQALVNYRFLHVQQILSNRATAFRLEMKEVKDEVDQLEVHEKRMKNA